MSLGDAISTYSLLTVGDGLVSQIPALLHLDRDRPHRHPRRPPTTTWAPTSSPQFGRQRQRRCRSAAARSLALCLIPGLPKLPFLLVGGGVLVVAQRLPEAGAERRSRRRGGRRRRSCRRRRARGAWPATCGSSRSSSSSASTSRPGRRRRGGDLLDRVRALRRKVALELGIVMPPVRTRDNLDLPPRTLRDPRSTASRSAAARPARHGARHRRRPRRPARPRRPREPVFGLAAKWVPGRAAPPGRARRRDRRRPRARSSPRTWPRSSAATPAGCSAARTSRRSSTWSSAPHPVVVEELTPAPLSLGEIQRVLQSLLDGGRRRSATWSASSRRSR